MPDKTSYFISVPGETGYTVDADKFNAKKDDFFKQYPDAQVTENSLYKHGETDIQPGDTIAISNPGEEPYVIDGAKFSQKAEEFIKQYPQAKISRMRPVGVWGESVRQEAAHNNLVNNLSGADVLEGDEQLQQRRHRMQDLQTQLNDFDKETDAILGAIPTMVERFRKKSGRMKERAELQKQLREEENGYYNSNAILSRNVRGKQGADIANEELDKVYAPFKEEADARRAEREANTGLHTVPYGFGAYADAPTYEDQLYTAAKNLNDDTARLYDAPSKYGNEKGFDNFMKGAKERVSQVDFWTMGLTGIADQFQLKGVFDKIRENLGGMKNLTEDNINEVLTPMEQQLLAAFFRNADAQAARAEDMSRGYQAGQTAADSLQFMAQFALSGGITSGATKALSNGAVDSFASLIGKWIGKEGASVARKAVGKAVGAVAESAVNMAFQPGTVKSILDQQNQLDENGEIVDQRKAALRGVGDYLIENISERSGELFNKVLGAPVNAIGKTNFGKRIAETPLAKWGKAFYDSGSMKLLRAGGFNGYFGEIFEEYFGDALRTVTGVDKDALKDSMTWDNLIVMATSFLPMSIIGGGMNMARYGSTKKHYNNNLRDFKATLNDLGFTPEQMEYAADTGRLSSPEDYGKAFGPVISEMAKRGASQAQLQQAFEFARDAAAFNVFEGFESARRDAQRSQALEELTATYGEFWRGDEQTGRTVDRVTLPDGQQGFVLNADETGMMSVKFDDGHVGFTTEGVGAQVQTSALDDYLDATILTDKQAREAAQMQEEEADARQQFNTALQQKAPVPMGTAENPLEGTLLTQVDPNTGIETPFRQPDGSYVVLTPDGTQTLVQESDLAKKWGIQLTPKTQEEKDADEVAEYEAAMNRKQTYNNIPRGTEIVANLEGMAEPVRYNFTHAEYDAEDKSIHIFVEDQETGEEVDLPEDAFSGLEQIAAREQQAREELEDLEASESKSGEEIEDLPETFVEGPRDYKGNPLPLNADGSVNETELWNKDPEAWATWNDEQQADGGADSIAYVQAAAKKAQGDLTKLEKQYAKELDFTKRKQLKEAMVPIGERIDTLNNVLAGYEDRAKQAKEEEEALKRSERAEKNEQNQPRTPVELAAAFLSNEMRSGRMKGKLNKADFARELGYGKNSPELQKFFAWWAKDGKGRTLVELAEDMAKDFDTFGIIPMDANAEQKDVQVARDAIIDLLGSVRVPSDIYNYIENERKAEAASERTVSDAEADRQSMIEHGMTAAEWMQVEASQDEDALNALNDEQQEDFLNFATYYYDAYGTGEQETAGELLAGPESGAETLRGEEPGDQGGIPRDDQAATGPVQADGGNADAGGAVPGGEPRGNEGGLVAGGNGTLEEESGAGSEGLPAEVAENLARIDGAIASASQPLDQPTAEAVVLAMENGAEPNPEIAYSDEEWDKQFPNNRVQTPVGEIKLGENQKTKLDVKKRKGQFGMMKPTMENPDVILYEEDIFPPEDAERTGKLLFIKTFAGPGEKQRTNFESVTVRRDNLEISISSHEVKKNALLEKLQTDQVVYMREALLSNSSERRLAEQNESVPDLVPTQESNASSDNKDSENSEQTNTSVENQGTIDFDTDVNAQVEEARQEVDTNPTEAQKEAGNYKKGHVTIDGFDISIENPKGSVRSGKDASGKEWSQTMNNDYGYIRRTEGPDGDHIDVFLSDNPAEGNVFVVDQMIDGKFDEHKVMYGFPDAESARAAYLSNYEEGWQGLGTITEVTREEFKKWVDSSHRKTKPFSEYKSVKAEGSQNGNAAETAQPGTKDQILALSQQIANLGKEYDRLWKEWLTNRDVSNFEERFAIKRQQSELKIQIENIIGKVTAEELDELEKTGGEALQEQVAKEKAKRDLVFKHSRISALVAEKQQVPDAKAKSVNKVNLYNYTDKKDSPRVSLTGVFHDDGYAVATDSSVLVAEKASYDKKNNGKIIGKDGKPVVHDGKEIKNYPKWRTLAPAVFETQKFNFSKLRDFLAGVKAAQEAKYDSMSDEEKQKNKKKEMVDRAKIILNLGDNKTVTFFLGRLSRFADFAEHIGAKELNFIDEKRAVHVKTAKGVALLMPIQIDYKDETESNPEYAADYLVEGGTYSFGQNEYQKQRSESGLTEAQEKALAFVEGKTQKEIRAEQVKKKEEERQKPLKERVAQWVERTGQEVEVLESRDQVVDQQAIEALDKGEKISGWFSPALGKVVVYLPNVDDVSEIDKTYMHEIIAHKGLRALLGKNWSTVMDMVWNDIMTDKEHDRYLRYNRHLEGTADELKRLAADEYVANLAEHIDDNPIGWEKFVTAIKEILRKMGLDIRLTDEDLKTMLAASLGRYEAEQRQRREQMEAEQAQKESGPIDLLQVAKEQAEKRRAERAASTGKKIEDFGEKIGGARKDQARERIKDSVKLTGKDLKELKDPDKILSRKNIAKYLAEGQMTRDDALTLLAANMAARNDYFRELGLVKYRDLAAAWERGEDVKFEITDKDIQQEVDKLGERIKAAPDIFEKKKKSIDVLYGRPYEDYRKTYDALDYPNVNRAIKSAFVRFGSVDDRYWVVAGPNANRGFVFSNFDTAIEKLKSLYPEIVNVEKEQAKAKQEGEKYGNLKVAKDEYGWYRIKSGLIPGNIYLSKKFHKKEEAEKYLAENAEALVEKETRLATAYMGSNIGMVERQGADYRNGKDVTEKEFMDTFGPRGIEFGNWVPQAERQAYLNKTYDAIMDFCTVVNISPKAFFFGGKLALAFGARGHSRALAHYEPVKVVINLTRLKGAGSLAHEWFHALDNYLAKQYSGNTSDMATSTLRAQRQEMSDAFRSFVRAMDSLDYTRRSNRAGEYWGEVWERAARLFEAYTYDVLGGKEIVSPLLVGKHSELTEEDQELNSTWPYPTIEENKTMKPFFDNLFATLQEGTDESGNVILFRRAGDKQAQFDIIQRTNPMTDDVHTGIRSVDDIKTWSEAVAQARKDAKNGGWDELAAYPDITNEDIEKALKSGRITIYSSYPIANGVFVSPSKMQAQDYAGDGEVYSKTVPVENVAWINTDEGQYAETQREIGNLMFRRANENQRIFISNAENALGKIKMDKATPEQWKKMLEKEGGLKAGEDKWLGLSEWLDASDRKTLTKDEVADFIQENQIQIEEENYGEADLSELQQEFDEIYDGIIDGVGEEGDAVVMDPMGQAWDELNSRHYGGDDFNMAFELDDRGIISVRDEDAAGYFLGRKPIESTRLSYTTEGLENKREIALTVPTIESWNEGDQVHFGDAGEGRAIAWTRFGDSRNSNDHKVLVIDEIQSKRHQEARESGYRDEEAHKAAENRVRELQEEWWNFAERVYGARKPTQEQVDRGNEIMSKEDAETRDRIKSRYNEARKEERDTAKGIPAAPFEKNWHELTMKRMLRLAAEEGYDYVAWTTGDQQADRYSLSSVIDRIEVVQHHDGTGERDVYLDKPGDREIELHVNKDGEVFGVGNRSDNEFVGKSLSDIIGKELAVKAMTVKTDKVGSAETVAEGEKLRIGGEGMKGFYDDILPRFMNKYGKKWGVKVEDIFLPNIGVGDGLTMHSVPITDEMRESVMEGQLMFRKAPNGAESNLSEDQYAQVRTPQFKKWFGVWDEVAKYYPQRSADSVDEAFKFVESLFDKPLKNKKFDLVASISKTKSEKLKSGKAIKESIDARLHALALANIDQVFENAEIDVVHPDTKGVREIEHVHRLGSLLFDKKTNDFVPVKLTVFEYNTNTGNKIYTIEAVDIEKEKTAGQLEDGSETSPRSPIAVFIAKIEKLIEKARGAYKNSSKVVDENGEPLVVYHGTPNDFDTFDASHIGETSGDRGLFGEGFYFNDNPRYVKLFARAKGGEGNIIAAFLNIRNPFVVGEHTYDELLGLLGEGLDQRDVEAMRPMSPDAQVKVLTAKREKLFTENLKKAGYDGVICPQMPGTPAQYVAFEPNQIKSATDNSGDFSTENNSILFRRSDEDSNNIAADLVERYDNQDGEKYPWMSEGELIYAIEENIDRNDDTDELFSAIDRYHALEDEDFAEGKRDFAGGEMEDLFDDILNRLRELAAEKADNVLFRRDEEQAAPTAEELVSKVQAFGLRGIMDKEQVNDYYTYAMSIIPDSDKQGIVDRALGKDLNVRRETKSYIAALAMKGYANDESGLLRALADRIAAEVNADIDEGSLLYMIWRDAKRYNKNDMLGVAEDVTMRKRMRVGEYGEKFPGKGEEVKAQAKEGVDKADEARSEAWEEARKLSKTSPFAAINKAMGAQRQYDRETVDGIVALAKQMIKEGNISAVNAREMARLLTIIRYSNGKRPETVKNCCEQLMDFMVDHTIETERDLLDKMLKVKTATVKAPGVDVQAKLDLRAQGIINTFRDNMSKSEEALRQAIAEKEDKIQDERTSETRREELEAEVDGLALALQYATEIAGNEAENASIREGIRDARSEFKNLSEEEQKQFAKALKEEEKASYDMIRKNKIDRVNAYRELRAALAGAITSGTERAKTFLEAQRERVNEIHHYANADLQGVSDDPIEDKAKGIKKLNNNAVARFLTSPLASFDQMLRMLGRKHVDGRGYLWNRFMNQLRDANDNEKLGLDTANETLNKKVQEIFKDETMTWNDLYGMERKMPKAKMRFFNANGEWTERELTQGNLLYIYMVDKMPDGQMKLRQMGITEEDVRGIKGQMDERFIKLADWIQEDFLSGLRDKYNEVHKRLFGTSMAAIDNYFPLRILGGVIREEVDLSNPDNSVLPSAMTGAIIKRTVNRKQLDITGADAFSVVIEHVREMEHWAAFAEVNKDLGTLLSYKRFQNQMKHLNTIYGTGKELWGTFKKTAVLAAGEYHPVHTALDKAAVNLAKGVTAAKISFRAYTALKQVLSWPAFVADASPVELAKATSPTSWKKNWEWAMQNLPNFKKRVESRKAGNEILEDTELDSKFWGTDFAKWLNQHGMSMNAFVDALTVSIGAKAMYESKRKQYIKEGFAEKTAERKAKMDAVTMFNETQQSSEKEFLSLMQADRTVASVALSVYRNSSFGYQRQVHQGLRTLGRMMKKGYKEESVAFMTKQLVREGLTEEQAAKAAEQRYNRAGYQALARVATFGFLTEFAWNLGSHLVYLLFGDDPDEKKAMLEEDAMHALLGGTIEGLAGGSVISEILNMKVRGESFYGYDLNTLPIMSDVKNLMSHWGTDKVAAMNELVFLGMQIGLGTNPQTFSDAIVAIIDACNGDMETSKEAMFCILRILQVPQSQLDQLMIDEIGMTAKDARRLSYQEIAQRYTDYKMMRNAPITGPLYSEELREKREKAHQKTFKKKYNERQKLKDNK